VDSRDCAITTPDIVLKSTAGSDWWGGNKHFNPMPWKLAVLMEVELAAQLRRDGNGVWPD
jgi:hypothetical protein